MVSLDMVDKNLFVKRQSVFHYALFVIEKDIMGKIKVVDNFLEKNIFTEIENILMGDKFPWFFNDFKSDSNDTNNYQFYTYCSKRKW